MPETADETDGVACIDSVSVIGLRFRSEYRLHAAAEFSSVFAARRILRGECFVLHYLEAGSAPCSSSRPTGGARLGLVVAKKLARRSVQRNLLKRLAREAFRHVYSKLPDCDVVLRLCKAPGHSMDTASRQALRADVDRLLTRLMQKVPPSVPQ